MGLFGVENDSLSPAPSIQGKLRPALVPMAVGGRTGSLYLRRNFPTLESREHGGRRPVKCLGQKGEGTGGVGCSKGGPKDRAEGSSDLEPSHGCVAGHWVGE